MVIISLGLPLLATSGNLPERQMVRTTPYPAGLPRSGSVLLGLAPGGVCPAGDITAPAGGLLHRRFTLTCLGLLSQFRQYASLLHLPSSYLVR